MKSPFVVTFSGDPVSGKSSAIAALSEKYKEEGFSIGESEEGKCVLKIKTGMLFRNLANHAGLSLEEFGAIAKSSGNSLAQLRELPNNDGFFDNLPKDTLSKSIDEFVDEYTLNYIETLKARYADKPDVIILVDSRIAGLLMNKNGKENMTIRFSTKPEVSAERLVKAANDDDRKGEIEIDGVSKKEALSIATKSIKERANAERERFKRNYGVDMQNLSNYNLLIDTSYANLDSEAEVLYSCIESAREGKKYEKYWRSSEQNSELSPSNTYEFRGSRNFEFEP